MYPTFITHARFPWGKEAFHEAKRLDKPIFLSVGYSTCHWCHVMEVESFENCDVADVMNKNFVNIKVDREVMPEVDRVYLHYVQRTTESGGWPMSVWLTPDLKPFFGGTYFPPSNQHGRPGFMTLCNALGDMWVKDKEQVLSSADTIYQRLKEDVETAVATTLPGLDSARMAFEVFDQRFDSKFGGFGSRPKFPTPPLMNFLLEYYAVTSDELKHSDPSRTELLKIGPNSDAIDKSSKNALKMVFYTLDCIARGGIHDHVGKGFHRYSVDERWHVPHFEKMLYDQAQLLKLYANAHLITGDQKYAEIVDDIVSYTSSNLQHPEGAFFCAQDADSLPKFHSQTKVEGAFATWTQAELRQVLNDEICSLFEFHFGVRADGNVPPSEDAHGDLRNQNVLMECHMLEDTARHFSMPVNEVKIKLKNACNDLLRVRNQRPAPHLDDKVITSWNALMISGLASAYLALGQETLYEKAIAACQFVTNNLFDPNEKKLKRCWPSGTEEAVANAQDHAFFVQALLDLFFCKFDETFLELANTIQQEQDRLFWDPVGGGGYFASSYREDIILRMKEDHDGAEPSSTAVSASNLQRLSTFYPGMYEAKLESLFRTFNAAISENPTSLPQLLSVLMRYYSPSAQVFISGPPSDESDQWIKACRSKFGAQVLFLDTGKKPNNQILRQMTAADNQEKLSAHVCRGQQCGLPVHSLQELVAQIQ